MALVPYPLGTAPGQRYRYEQWAPYLEQQGIRLTFFPFGTDELARVLYRRGEYLAKSRAMIAGLARRWRDARAASRFDLVLVQREAALVGPAWTERLAKAHQPRFVYDFDDAVYLRYVSPANRYLSFLKFPSKTRSICRLASLILAGNSTLAEYGKRYARRVEVVPSTVSLKDYRPRPAGRFAGPPVIGWTGSHSSVQYLRLIEGALREVHRRRPFRLVLVGASGFSLDGLDVVSRQWNPSTEVRDLWDFDVGVMPLPDEPWAQGKCGMKAIQYMGVGVPAVVSPVGANRTIVRHGVDGFTPRNEREWVEALSGLLENESLRRQMGESARASVEASYCAEAQAPRVCTFLRGLVDLTPTGPGAYPPVGAGDRKRRDPTTTAESWPRG